MKFSNHIYAVAIAFSVLTITSCAENYSQSDDKGSSNNMQATEAAGEPKFEQGKEQEQVNRKLIWTADLEFQVKNVNKSTEEINKLSEKYDGFVSDMNMAHNSHRISNTITVRVPNSKFQKFVSAIKGESLFLDRADISSQDVTEEFVDIEARLKAKREVRDRYIEVLQTKAGTVKEILEAEEAIRVITEEIEAKEGRLRFLNNRVDLSTVTIHMYQKVKFVDSPDRFEKDYSDEVGESFGNGWQAVKIILLMFVTIWPILLAGLITLIVFKRKKIMGMFKRS